MRSLKVFLASAFAVGALFAVSANAALATTWNPNPTGGYITAPSGFTVTKAGDVKTCTIAGKGWNGFFFGEGVTVGLVSASCTGGTTFQWNLSGKGQLVEGQYQLKLNNSLEPKTYTSPWGEYSQCYSVCFLPAPIGNWTNGSGATPSKVTFTNQAVGKYFGTPITLSGTFNVTTLEGGLLTIK